MAFTAYTFFFMIVIRHVYGNLVIEGFDGTSLLLMLTKNGTA